MSTLECSDDELLSRWLAPDEPLLPAKPDGMTCDERVRAWTFLGYLWIELDKRYGGENRCAAWLTESETKAAFEAARYELTIMLSVTDWKSPVTLLAGITVNAVHTLLWEELGHTGHTDWIGRPVGPVMAAVQKVREGLAVTAV